MKMPATTRSSTTTSRTSSLTSTAAASTFAFASPYTWPSLKTKSITSHVHPLITRHNTSQHHRHPRWTSELVVVVGATGGVGRLVVNRLIAACHAPRDDPKTSNIIQNGIEVTHVHALVRNAATARQALPSTDSALTITEVKSFTPTPSNATTSTTPTSVDPSKTQSAPRTLDYNGEHRGTCIRNALRGASALVICTGTTAFPTRAWRGGNTPYAVDDRLVHDLTNSIDPTTIRRIVHVSSIGTQRSNRFPFSILNTFGVLDAKRRGENHVKTAARTGNFAYSVVRTGRLVGEPQTNVGMLRSKPNAAWLDIKVARGDALVGDLSRVAAADAVIFATMWDTDANLDFSVVHSRGCSPPAEKWEKLMAAVQQRK